LEAVAQAEAELKPEGGRVLLRYSGTEPKARLLIEGRDAAALERWSQKIRDLIRQQVGS
jgi:phosphoglucosamine mutase